ncbi:hypothetical protein [Anaerosporobacter sp.]|uniref:hypothetical protein n=1 Tax=Anaerosporobacter sp. TaxID=1872529 RepID=UPI00286F2E0D|nr:hypothetical protein [Anaerosporobacter sp.]
MENKNKNRSKALLLIGIILVVFTGALYLLLVKDRTTQRAICLGFMMGAEVVFFGGMLGIEFLSKKTSQIILRTVCGIALGIGSLVSIVVSYIYIVGESDGLTHFYSLQLIIWVIACVVFIIGYFTASSVKKSETGVMNAVVTLTEVINQLNLLSSDAKNAPYSKQIKKIAEELRYSDTSSLVPSDEKIGHVVAKLDLTLMQEYTKEEKDVKVENLLSELLALINKRKQEVKLTKVGGI